MSAEKVSYGPIEPGRRERAAGSRVPHAYIFVLEARRERAAGSRVFLAGGVFGAAAVFTAVVALAMVLNNMSQQMARDHEEIMILKARLERSDEKIADLKASAQSDKAEIAMLRASAEKDRLQTMFLMERITLLESQIPPSHDDHQMPDTGSVQSPEAEDAADGAVVAGAKVPNKSDTLGVHKKRSRRSVPNWEGLLTRLSEESFNHCWFIFQWVMGINGQILISVGWFSVYVELKVATLLHDCFGVWEGEHVVMTRLPYELDVVI
ncbi:Hypp2404 [Branchiostoma lanceolatum]|uniref:Hypp2404 protein n=1 Tax=Branchiostoma lanceolatum TaxID=7740 RepID=A0A8K0EPM7_BRALA|nr:Hypp2404 [Branchiostoma lanceolatum]